MNYSKKFILAMIFCLSFHVTKAQVSTGSNNGGGGDYVGWDGSMGIALDVKTINPFNIDFSTGNTIRMNLIGNGLYNNGYLGIGRTFPRFRLEVSNNIGLLPRAWDEAYYVDSVPVVRSWPLDPLGVSYPNIFVGARAGLNVNNVGINLTFIGENAGIANTTGDHNTFVGNKAGISNTTGQSNVFIGRASGNGSTTGDFNVFLGTLSGQNNTTGSRNTAVGDRAYSSGGTSVDNTVMGFDSGINLSSGDSNLFAGSKSAFSQTTGSNNVSLGVNAGSTFTTGNNLTLIGANTIADNNLTNSSAIGNGVWVRSSNNLILGDNNTFVGIGLSGVASGPQVPLEINTPGTSAGTGNSGIRLRDLTSSSSSALTGVTKFLTVNNNGDMVLGDIPGGGGPISACSSPGLGTAAIGYVPRVSAANELCRSQIYDNGTNVGIGVATSPNTNMKVHLKGDFYVQHDAGAATPKGGDIFMNDASGNIERIISMYGLGGFNS